MKQDTESGIMKENLKKVAFNFRALQTQNNSCKLWEYINVTGF